MEICFAVRHTHGYKKIVEGFFQNKLLKKVHCHSGPASNIYLVAAGQISVGFAGVELWFSANSAGSFTQICFAPKDLRLAWLLSMTRIFGLLQAVKYFHDNMQIHRDLKAGNILLSLDARVSWICFFLGWIKWLRRRPLIEWWFQTLFIFTPTWGNDPIFLNIFQKGWNHQLVEKVPLDKSWFNKMHNDRTSATEEVQQAWTS